MKVVRKAYLIAASIFVAACGGGGGGSSDGQPNRSQLATLGRKIFFDSSLSSPEGMSCATCHDPRAKFSDPTHQAASVGAVLGRRGVRNAPSIMYSLYSPVFGFSDEEGDFVGGQFHDGSATTLEQQARKPFFGAAEMNIRDVATFRDKISQADYRSEFEAMFGGDIFQDPEDTLSAAAGAIELFENSPELRPFSSKYDLWAAGKVKLSEQEMRGLALFTAPNKGNCAACHPVTGADGSAREALFTDFTYDNIGLPANRAIRSDADFGLSGVTGRPSDVGRFKVASLRNVADTPPYFHNGIFSSLEEVVHFYNSRDVDPAFDNPEFAENMNRTELGNLGLTLSEEADLVAFLRTLSDGYQP